MRPLLSSAQALELDRRSQKEFNIPEHELMESAGQKSAEKFQELFPDFHANICILCGPGHNAGDGAVMAAELLKRGYKNISLVPLFPANVHKPLLEKYIKRLPPSVIIAPASLDLNKQHVIVDAIFGVGLTKPLSSDLQLWAQKIRKAKVPVVALDIASGLDGSTGEILGDVFKSTYTFTFGAAKIGHVIRSGPESSGKVFTLDIGFPEKLRDDIATCFRVGRIDVLQNLPDRSHLGNKTTFGKVKVWAGSAGFWGAGVLSSRAAFRVGAGYVIWEQEKENLKPLEFIPEVLLQTTAPVTSDFVYAVGPGLGTGEATKKRIEELYENKIQRVVLDADALTVVAKHNLSTLPSWIMTPHTGELSRLLGGLSSKEIEANRPAALKKAQDQFKCIIVLKGYHSMISMRDKTFVIPTGNSALAKAGSGDVLTGMLAGLWAQGLSSEQAAITATYLHGLLADLWIRRNDIRGLTPSDLLLGIPRLMKALYFGKTKNFRI